ncbi:siderophore ABC transporter substrate-binding protein [Lysinibacter sp. HNR]|uniref:siderophore ABC transporter substrate-binding protein n=1 Tax=Lysinibacter sp. HNR TaxID=3031408 RepID=UPI0024351327|nr:siderophore ABC transporter substrate-binding protein [Lysinibacter sp. HNR]WGD38522.1 siderophore ABC transporter substrate-binding protein [Lysinibacter sp. HNR]
MRPKFARATGTLAVMTASTLILAACSPATSNEPTPTGEAVAEITVEHAQGSTVVPLSPEKVVTFDMASLDTLDTLGVEIAGVPHSNIPDYLSKYLSDSYPDVGTLFEPNYELLNEIDPDLIIISHRTAEVFPELSEVAPTIDLSLDFENYFDSFRSHVETLAEIFELEDEAAERLKALDTQIGESQELAQTSGTGLIISTSAGEISAHGTASRYGWIHELLGVAPAVEDVEGTTNDSPVPAEFILNANPDRLFVIDRDIAIRENGPRSQELLDNDAVRATTAWSNGNVTYIEPEQAYIVLNGLTAFSNMVGQVQAGLR